MKETSPVVEGLLMIHRIITRGLNTSIQQCEKYIDNKGIPGQEMEGYSKYLATLKWVMHAHHTTEDELGFPYFKDHIEAPYDQLKKDHFTLALLLEKIEPSPSALHDGGIMNLREVLVEIKNLWTPHINIEQEKFSSENVNSFISMKEQIKLAKEFGEHSGKNAGPGPLALPFMFYDLEKEDREEFLKSFPWILKSFLVPVVWKRQWKSMIPYLLS